MDVPTEQKMCFSCVWSLVPTIVAALFSFWYTPYNLFSTLIATTTVFFCTWICFYQNLFFDAKMVDPDCPKWRAETMRDLESDHYMRKGRCREKDLKRKQRDLAELAKMKQRDRELLA